MKTSIKDKIEGNELDLSLNELTEVPVQDLATAPKATHLDLSCNKIKALPNNFSSLTHLVKIDLSKNLLTELPENFGKLINLQYLDLYGNQITVLPISFCHLKNLKWLDLKNNPLDPTVKAIAGDCLDQKQCQTCAKSVVTFMQSIESELERQKQKKLKEERLKEAKRLAEEAEKLMEQRRLKKEEREKRKAKIKALLNKNEEEKQLQPQKNSADVKELTEEKIQCKTDSCWRVFIRSTIMIVVVLCALAFLFVMRSGHEVKHVEDLIVIFRLAFTEVKEATEVWFYAFALPYFTSLQNWTQSVM